MSACATLRSMSAISMVVFLPGCFSTGDNGSLLNDGTEVIHNKLSVEERSDGWELLFDGISLDQWRGYGRDDMPEAKFLPTPSSDRSIPVFLIVSYMLLKLISKFARI